jgi:hypothetical protein
MRPKRLNENQILRLCYNGVMKQVKSVSVKELAEMAGKMYGSLVKADVDVAKKIVVIDMGMHADGEAYLLEQGSNQSDLWGINLHPDKYSTDEFVEFDSMINLRPSQGNLSKGIDDTSVRTRVLDLIAEVVHE